MASDPVGLPADWFDRADNAPDAQFYGVPRLVTHIDDAAIGALSDCFKDILPDGGNILDLMSSCVSHYPNGLNFSSVTGLGMNRVELDANPVLTARVIHDLNRDPVLPFDDQSFDGCTITVSVQYLTRPLAVFTDLARVLRPGAPCISPIVRLPEPYCLSDLRAQAERSPAACILASRKRGLRVCESVLIEPSG